MTNLTRSSFQHHPSHIVSPSPWPFNTSNSLLVITLAAALTFQVFTAAKNLLNSAFLCVIGSAGLWFRDLISEATYIGNHTLAVQKGLSLGMGLFIVSEALFFLAIFWAFFHSAFSPSIELGANWPPLGIESINPFELPLLNTVILLSSGVTVTRCHHSVIKGDRTGGLSGLAASVLMAAFFSFLQAVEYIISSFTLSDGTYTSCFYFATGFHGFHVIVGTAFLTVGLWRLLAYHLTENHHLGLEFGILYWHFVDIVWLILYISVYYWGS